MIAVATDRRGAEAVAHLVEQIRREGLDAPGGLVVFATASHDLQALQDGLLHAFPGVRTWGGTTCRAVLTQRGAWRGDVVGVLALPWPDDAFGTAAEPLGTGPRDAAKKAVESALSSLGRPGEAPAIIGVCAAPGGEEAVVAGIADAVGPSVPLLGGSSADDTVEGAWQQLADRRHTKAVAVSVWFPPGQVHTSMASGYLPSPRRAVVTDAEGRTLKALDGRPAREVYDDWTAGSLTEAGEVILAATTFRPLGRVVGHLGDAPLYALIHPERQLPGGSMTLFTDVAIGEELTLMQGSRASLVSRAARVAQEALAGLDGRCAGALVTFCAGCMLAVEDELETIATGLAEVLQVPFLTHFSFGEQGCLAPGHNVHGNLMIAVTVFEEG